MSGRESVATNANAVAASDGHASRSMRYRALPHATSPNSAALASRMIVRFDGKWGASVQSNASNSG
jgi:hypothetical protein